MSAMKNLHQNLTEKNIDPELWQAAFDAESDFPDYLLACDLAIALDCLDGVDALRPAEVALAAAQERWPLTV